MKQKIYFIYLLLKMIINNFNILIYILSNKKDIINFNYKK